MSLADGLTRLCAAASCARTGKAGRQRVEPTPAARHPPGYFLLERLRYDRATHTRAVQAAARLD